MRGDHVLDVARAVIAARAAANTAMIANGPDSLQAAMARLELRKIQMYAKIYMNRD